MNLLQLQKSYSAAIADTQRLKQDVELYKSHKATLLHNKERAQGNFAIEFQIEENWINRKIEHAASALEANRRSILKLEQLIKEKITAIKVGMTNVVTIKLVSDDAVVVLTFHIRPWVIISTPEIKKFISSKESLDFFMDLLDFGFSISNESCKALLSHP